MGVAQRRVLGCGLGLRFLCCLRLGGHRYESRVPPVAEHANYVARSQRGFRICDGALFKHLYQSAQRKIFSWRERAAFRPVAERSPVLSIDGA